MKRILIHEDKNLLNEMSQDLRQYLPYLEQVKKTYEKLQLGDFDDEILKLIVGSGTTQIEKLFNDSLSDQLEKSGISNIVLKENILKGSEKLMFEFLEKFSTLKRFKPETYSRRNYLKLNSISFENGSFTLNDKNKAIILENECSVYLENEIEKDFFDNLQKLIDAYDNVNKNLEQFEFRFNYVQGKGLPAIANFFFKANEADNGYKINPNSLKFALHYKENSLKYRN